MNAKEYLKQIQLYDIKIRQKAERLQELHEQAQGLKAVTYDGDKVQTSPEDRMAAIMARYVDLAVNMGDDLVRLSTLRNEITDRIQTLENPSYIIVLYMRYVSCSKWEEIAEHLSVDERTVYRIHGRALQAFADKVVM